MNALNEARRYKKGLAVLWLDIANAYGTVPHCLIFFALKRYGVHESFIKIINNYYEGLWSKSFSNFAPSGWHRHLRGIFAGCTLSIILFLAAINIVLEFLSSLDIRKFTTTNNVSLPLARAFMDDSCLMSSSVADAQRALDSCVSVRMYINYCDEFTCIDII